MLIFQGILDVSTHIISFHQETSLEKTTQERLVIFKVTLDEILCV
jgi:hypothetical protein